MRNRTEGYIVEKIYQIPKKLEEIRQFLKKYGIEAPSSCDIAITSVIRSNSLTESVVEAIYEGQSNVILIPPSYYFPQREIEKEIREYSVILEELISKKINVRKAYQIYEKFHKHHPELLHEFIHFIDDSIHSGALGALCEEVGIRLEENKYVNLILYSLAEDSKAYRSYSYRIPIPILGIPANLCFSSGAINVIRKLAGAERVATGIEALFLEEKEGINFHESIEQAWLQWATGVLVSYWQDLEDFISLIAHFIALRSLEEGIFNISEIKLPPHERIRRKLFRRTLKEVKKISKKALSPHVLVSILESMYYP